MKNYIILLLCLWGSTRLAEAQSHKLANFIMGDGEKLMLSTSLKMYSGKYVIANKEPNPLNPKKTDQFFKCKGPDNKKVWIKKSDVDTIIVGTNRYVKRYFEGMEIFGYPASSGEISTFRFHEYKMGNSMMVNGVQTAPSKVLSATLLTDDKGILSRIDWSEKFETISKSCKKFRDYQKNVKKSYLIDSKEELVNFYNNNCQECW